MKRFSLDIPQPFKKRCGFEVVRVCVRESGGGGGGGGGGDLGRWEKTFFDCVI